MHVRIARFEGLDLDHIDEQVAERKREMEAARSGNLPDGAPPQVRTLAESVTRVMELVDRANGTGVTMVFTETEDDMRRADAALNEMSPEPSEGRRTSVDTFEVVLQVDMS
jgi:hypothetical protein